MQARRSTCRLFTCRSIYNSCLVFHVLPWPQIEYKPTRLSTCQSRRSSRVNPIWVRVSISLDLWSQHANSVGVHVSIPLGSMCQFHRGPRVNPSGTTCQSHLGPRDNQIGSTCQSNLGTRAKPVEVNVRIPSGSTCQSHLSPRANSFEVHVPIPLGSTCKSRRSPRANLIEIRVPIQSGSTC